MTPILRADIDREWLTQWIMPCDRGDCSPLDAALLDACPVVFDMRQYQRAAALGLSGRLASVLFEAVIFDGLRFRLAMHCEDHRDAEIAFLMPAENAECEIADLVAWVPETGRVGTLLGEVGTLGLSKLPDWQIAPMPVCETLADWLKADVPSLFILEPQRAARELAGVTLAAADHAAAKRLHRALAPVVLNIVAPRRAA